MTCSDAISFVGCSGMLAKQVLFQLSYSPREKSAAHRRIRRSQPHHSVSLPRFTPVKDLLIFGLVGDFILQLRSWRSWNPYRRSAARCRATCWPVARPGLCCRNEPDGPP
jgi:hypothetical protein